MLSTTPGAGYRPFGKGQAATEFLLMSFLILFFLFLFFQLAISMTVSEYFQYVAFMAARTNMVHTDPAKAREQVKETIRERIGTPQKTIFGPFARLLDENYLISPGRETAHSDQWAGVNLKFSVPMFIPFIPLPADTAATQDDSSGLQLTKPAKEMTRPKDVALEVQAVLGKEPSCALSHIACDNGD